MLTLEELKKDIDLINEIQWDMTPEQAVKQYLEWGNTDWGSGKYVIRSKSDYTTYFVVNCWFAVTPRTQSNWQNSSSPAVSKKMFASLKVFTPWTRMSRPG
jgi:hypothetical protein